MIKTGAVATRHLQDAALAANELGRAKVADGFFDALTLTATLADDAVTSAVLEAKLEDNAVTSTVLTAKVADDAITGAVLLAKVEDQAFTAPVVSALFVAGAIGTTQLGELVLKSATSSAVDVVAVRTAPGHVLVAAPGAGKVLELVSALVTFDVGSGGSVAAGSWVIRYSGTPTTDATDPVVLGTLNVDNVVLFQPRMLAQATVNVENRPLTLFTTASDPAWTGVDTVRVRINYRVHTLSF